MIATASDWLLDFALSPGLWLSVLLALGFSAIVYGWRGGGGRQFGRDFLAGCLGFAAGQLLNARLHLDWARLGQIDVLTGALGSALAMFLGRLVVRK
jgi:hypothetical protein